MSELAWPRDIEQAEFILLTTYRRTGEGVSTPVWFLIDGDELLVTTMTSTGKAKRLRHSARVTLCACDRRGKVLGPEHGGTAELLPAQVGVDIRRRVINRYGLQGQILDTMMRVIGRLRSRTAQHPVGIRIVTGAPAE